MKPDDVLINHCYRMKSGALCRVNAFTEHGVVFYTYETEEPGDPEEMPVAEFAASVEAEAPLPRTG